MVQSLITIALAVTGSFERLAIFANIAALALYLGCAVASWRLRVMGVSARRGRRIPSPIWSGSAMACVWRDRLAVDWAQSRRVVGVWRLRDGGIADLHGHSWSKGSSVEIEALAEN